MSPVTSSFSSSSVIFQVPAGHKGAVLTCTGTGWPAPTLQWRQNGRVITRSSPSVTSPKTSVYSSLHWSEGFQKSDAGVYTCEVVGNDTQLTTNAVSVQLKSSLAATATSTTAVPCKVDTSVAHFQLRVLDTDCQSWQQQEGKRELLATEFRKALVSVLEVGCEECGGVEVGEVVVIDGPTCSKQLPGAAVFNGEVNTGGVGRTSELFCGLSRWQQSRPFLLLDSRLHQLDHRCVLEAEASGYAASQECAALGTSTFSTVVIAGAVTGGVVLLGMLLLILGCWKVSQKTRRKTITQPSAPEKIPEKGLSCV